MSFDLLLQNGTIVIGADGDFATVSDGAKLIQDVVKMITTPQGSDKYNVALGSLVNERLIGQVLSPNTTTALLQSSVQEALITLQKLQQAQAQKQALSPAETLVSLNSVEVSKDASDPRQLNVLVKFMAGDGNLIPQVLTMRVA